MSLKLDYRNLETQCFHQLRTLIEKSTDVCQFTGQKCLDADKETDGEYCSIILLNDRLLFVDIDGMYSDVYQYRSLETLIDLVENNSPII